MTDDDATPKPGRLPSSSRRAAVDYVEEEITANHEGDELRVARATRPTPQRLEHLEGRVDGVVTAIGGWRAEVGEQIGTLSGEIQGLAGEVRGLATVVTNSVRREHVTFKAQVDVDTAQQIDQVDAVKARRERFTQAFKLVASAVTGAIALATAALAAGRC